MQLFGMGLKASTAVGVLGGGAIGSSVGAGLGLTADRPESPGRITRPESGGLILGTVVGGAAGALLLPHAGYSGATLTPGRILGSAAVGATLLGSAVLAGNLID